MIGVRARGAWVLAFALVACSTGDDGPVGPGPDPGPVRFLPPAGGPSIVPLLGEQVFRVEVDGASDFEVRFVVGTDTVSTLPQWTFRAERLEDFTLEAVVRLAGRTYRGLWEVRVDDSAFSPVPPVRSLGARDGRVPGSIDLEFDRPSGVEEQLGIVSYEIAYAHAEFAAEDFDRQTIARVPHVPGFIRQPNSLLNLSERTVHHLRVRAVDAAGRVSRPEPGPAASALVFESTGHFALRGRVRLLNERANGPNASPASAVIVEGSSPSGLLRTITDGAGGFVLDGLVDVGQWTLTVQEESDRDFYRMVSVPLDPVDRSFDLLLYPRGFVDLPRVEAGEPSLETRLEFLLRMTGNASAVPARFVTWRRFPILLHVHEYVYQGPQGPVSYGDAFRRAARVWNEAVGAEVFEVVPASAPVDGSDPSLTGGFYAADLVPGVDPHLGLVVLVRPASGTLFEVEPQLMKIRLQPNFDEQYKVDFVVAHEVGHLIGLRHTPSRDHLMAKSPDLRQGGLPHSEEALVARMLVHVVDDPNTLFFREIDGP